MNYEEIIPRELWQQILVDVSVGDLSNVVKTSRHMNDMASWPDLWAGMRVNIKMVKENGLAQMYSIKRYEKVKKLDFTGMTFTSEELEQILKEIPDSPLEEVNFSGVNLSGIPAELLARAVSHLQTFDLLFAKLTADQRVKVLEARISSTKRMNVNCLSITL